MQTPTPGSERRMAKRFALTLPTEIRFDGLDCTGYLADVSRTGAFVRANEEEDPLLSVLQLGDWLELRLAPIGGKALAIPARVVHRRNQGIGVEFRQAQAQLDAEQGAFDHAAS